MAESSFLYVASQFATSFAGLAAKKGEIGQAEYAHQRPPITVLYSVLSFPSYPSDE